MSHVLPQFPLLRFTFYSLQFCGTPVETWRGQQLMTAVHQWYLPFIQAGAPVPLSLAIDLAWLLLNPRDTPHGFVTNQKVTKEVAQLSQQYRKTLDELRQQEDFLFVTELVQTIHDEQRRNQVIKTFLETLFFPISGIEKVYSFTSRDLKIHSARINSKGAEITLKMPNGSLKSGNVRFGVINKVADTTEGLVIRDVLSNWIDYFQKHQLSEVLTPDLKIVLELTATSRFGKGRVDYLFLNWLLNRPTVEDVEEEEPAPRMVDEEIPTNPFQTEGQTGGYIDVQRRKFSGSLGAVLPSELGLWRVKPLMLQKLLNEGMLTYVRESFEFIDRELRLIFCFIIDNDPRMLQTRKDVHPDLPRGLTPYIRARALAALMSRDICRFMPREDVLVDTGMYLWSPNKRDSQQAEQSCPAELNVFDVDRTTASDRFKYLRYLMSMDPELFYSRIRESDANIRSHLEQNPDEFIENRHRHKHYHGRHVVVLSSNDTSEELIEGLTLELELGSTGCDSLFIVNCDTDESTLGLESPDQVGAGSFRTQVSEEFLRQTFLESVICKAAGKPLRNDLLIEMETLA